MMSRKRKGDNTCTRLENNKFKCTVKESKPKVLLALPLYQAISNQAATDPSLVITEAGKLRMTRELRYIVAQPLSMNFWHSHRAHFLKKIFKKVSTTNACVSVGIYYVAYLRWKIWGEILFGILFTTLNKNECQFWGPSPSVSSEKNHRTEAYTNWCNAALWIFPENALGEGPAFFIFSGFRDKGSSNVHGPSLFKNLR